MNQYIQEQLNEIRAEIAQAAAHCGRAPEEIKLVAVSKTFTPADIMSAYACGQRRFGENKIQELEMKAAILPPDIEWHLLGHLQSNKAVKAVQYAACIHSVDSIKLIQRLDRLAGEAYKKPKILLEVNISGESTKFGASSENDILAMAEAAAQAANIELAGLMTMAPYEADNTELHRIFKALRQLRDKIEARLNICLPELSMGMSGDFPAAIAEGATFVRIGTA
ncbi:MAG: YggS family pyridoxal phosphate-dependent enzyme, partial [Victivallaceae bacterium]